jgi:hypothetical protein
MIFRAKMSKKDPVAGSSEPGSVRRASNSRRVNEHTDKAQKAGLRSSTLPAASSVQRSRPYRFPITRSRGVNPDRMGLGGTAVERRLSPVAPPGQWLHGRGRWALRLEAGTAELGPEVRADCATSRPDAQAPSYKL